jgi:uncharacterized protein
LPVDPAPLTWNVAQLLGELAGSTRHYDISGVTIPLPEPLRLADPIEGRVDLSRTNRGLIVRAELATALEGECSRCLRAIEVPVTIRIEEEALPTIHPESGLPLDIEDEPDALRLNDHHELELDVAVAEAISLAEPIAPLCEPDCPGLCPVCGERLDTPHDHGEDDIDPRLAALRAFRPVDDDQPAPDTDPAVDAETPAGTVAGPEGRPREVDAGTETR